MWRGETFAPYFVLVIKEKLAYNKKQRWGDAMYHKEQRERIIQDMEQSLTKEFPQTNQYNVLIFGSFLTDRYHEDSDIDIGVFSLDERLMFQIYMYLCDYFDNMNIDHDIIRMVLDENQYINVNIILYHEREVTDYCPEELIEYTRKMVDLYGTNPMETIRKKIVQEVGLNDNNW